MINAREKIKQKILADIRKRVDTYWSESLMNDAGFSDTAKAAKEDLQKWAARDLKFLLETVEMLREEQRLWSDGTIIMDLCDMEVENARLRTEIEALKNGGHFTALELAKIACVGIERDNLRAELEAAKRDLKMVCDKCKCCRTCAFDQGHGQSDCGKNECHVISEYVWRGVCAENGGAK